MKTLTDWNGEHGQPIGKPLTAKQEMFCRVLVAEGLTQADAYRRAYDTTGKPETVQQKASQLMANGRVRARVEELKAQASRHAGLTMASHLRDLERLRDEAAGMGAYGPAVTAEISRGRAAGLYEARATVTVQGLDWKALLGGPGEDES